MASLPKLDSPIYDLTLPSGKAVKYRPFTVKERSILLLALQEGDADGIYAAVGRLFELCTFGECIIENMPIVDSERLFIAIRNKSIGEELELVHVCECAKENSFVMHLDDVSVSNEPPSKDIELGQNIWLKMKYPTLRDSAVLSENPTESEIIQVISNCIESIISGSSIYKAADSTQEEMIAFVESMTQYQVSKIEQFFEALPKITVTGGYKCNECGKENKVTLEGLHNFFV